MGNSGSKAKDSDASAPGASRGPFSSLKNAGGKVKEQVEEEIGRRMMIQREVQMAINISKARDMLQIFGSTWAVYVSGLVAAKAARKPVPPAAIIPVVAGGLLLGNMADMAYGNKLQRVSREAEYILEHERERMVPLKQAPMAKYYSDEEKSAMFDQATPAGLLWPSSLFSRSFAPAKASEQSKPSSNNN